MIYQFIQFYLAIFLALFLPGHLATRAIFGKKYSTLLSPEKLLLSFLLGLVATDFLMLTLDFFQITINKPNLLIGLLVLSAVFALIARFTSDSVFSFMTLPLTKNNKLPFSKRQLWVFAILFTTALVLRGIYIVQGIIPKSTDLGHHMYWAKYISTTGTLPTYDAKFIIGEHLPFAAINLLSNIPYVSAFPTVIIFIFNIFTLLGVFLLIYRLAKIILPFFQKFYSSWFDKLTPLTIAFWGLFTIGVLYPISAPQAKFISGGVIGNIIGNFLFIVIIYAFFLTIIRRSTAWANIFLLSLLTIIYTHHLSTFVLAYSLLLIFFSFAVLTLIFLKFDFSQFGREVWRYLKLFTGFLSITIILLGLLFIIKIHPPSYLNPSAIDTAVGTPTKITRVGISLPGIIDRIGAWRVLFAGIFTLFFLPPFLFLLNNSFRFVRKFPKISSISPPSSLNTTSLLQLALTVAVLFAWTKIIFLMSWQPALLKIDIPSNRLITYLTYPLSILSALGVALLFQAIFFNFPKRFFSFLFAFFLIIAIISGVAQDIALNFRIGRHRPQDVMETYRASEYLAEKTGPQNMILKDHKYLAGDTWIKLFFMRGYKYPLSRTYNRRYEDKYNKHETCTRDMIAIPNSEVGQDCFEKTGVKYIFLKKNYDDTVFLNSPEFQEIYSSQSVRIFEKTD
jgi:hypothetical protein